MPKPDLKQIATLRINDNAGGGDTNRAGGVQPIISGNRRGAVWAGADGLAGFVSAAGEHDPIAGAVSGGRFSASGAGAADGGDIGRAGGSGDLARPRFEQNIRPGGYAWWYVDAISDDGAHALTLIAFIGSVFSPYYAWANAKAPARPENFCAMNMVLYEGRGGYWAMTERKRHRLSRSPVKLQIGPSGLGWENGVLTAEIDEITVPIPRRLRGRLTFTPERIHPQQFALDADGRHRWQPIAPRGRIEVAFEKPGLSWSGQAYFDTNDGDAPLGNDFSVWNWSRSEGADIFYDAQRRDGSVLNLALQVGDDGIVHCTPPPVHILPKTGWRVTRQMRADAGAAPVILKTLEDAPFYARSMIRADIGGRRQTVMHESLDLNRFASPWVKCLLPFRMPRR